MCQRFLNSAITASEAVVSVHTPGVAAGAFEDAAADDVGEADAAGEDAATLDLEVEVDELGEVDEDCLLPFKGRE